jgi:condensin complex subunit 2
MTYAAEITSKLKHLLKTLNCYWQVASCTLDASTKIYAYRVDCVHTDVLKMAGGLAAGYRKKHTDAGRGEEGEDGQDGSGENGETVRTKKKSRKVNKMCE